MKNILSSSIILFVSTITFAQNSEQYIDSAPRQNLEPFIINNGKDTLFLEPIVRGGEINEWYISNEETISEETEKKKGLTKDSLPKKTFQTFGKKVTIANSIDLNDDGVKEIFLAREMQGTLSPPNPGPYGVGIERHYYQQYEVWDVKTKRKIFEVQNMNEGDVAVSTNVMRSFGYRFKVDILKDGTIDLSDTQGNFAQIEMGKYVFDKKTGTYHKE